ncbi:GAF domain-containing protein [Vibrio proteolyticus]
MELNAIAAHHAAITQKLNQIATDSGLHSLLVMQSMPNEMVVFAANTQEIYSPGDAGPKSNQAGCHELYCERVIDTNQPLLVGDARTDAEWQGNEDLVKFDLGTYYGVPIHCQGQAVGTVCALSRSPVDFHQGRPSVVEQIDALRAEIEALLHQESAR